MSTTSFGEKTIIEERQGEAIDMQAVQSNGKKLYLESYGCQMNFSDSEIVASVLIREGFTTTRNEDEADVVLLNTCSIRENAEQRVRNRLTEFKKRKENKPSLGSRDIGLHGRATENKSSWKKKNS
jgi:tRNA-2-methylthio-N6-dimethylallyladenosine synthase